MKLVDLWCRTCETKFPDQWVEGSDYPKCPECGGERNWLPSAVANFEHGPIYFPSLDRTLTRSELKAMLKAEKLDYAPSADKHHGARNESHLNLGKKFSYAGQTNRS